MFKYKKIEEFYFDKSRGNYRSNCKECVSKQRKNNRDNIKKYYKKYRLDPNVRIRAALGCRLSTFITRESDTLLKYIGCSYEYLLNWLQFQLFGNMTMENYGRIWHIDHCIPCNNFDLTNEEEIYKCFNWNNLRPLTQEKNCKKGSKIIIVDIVLQELKATVYEKTSLYHKSNC